MNIEKLIAALKPFVKDDNISITTLYKEGRIEGFRAFTRKLGAREFRAQGNGEDAIKKAWEKLEKWMEGGL